MIFKAISWAIRFPLKRTSITASPVAGLTVAKNVHPSQLTRRPLFPPRSAPSLKRRREHVCFGGANVDPGRAFAPGAKPGMSQFPRAPLVFGSILDLSKGQSFSVLPSHARSNCDAEANVCKCPQYIISYTNQLEGLLPVWFVRNAKGSS